MTTCKPCKYHNSSQRFIQINQEIFGPAHRGTHSLGKKVPCPTHTTSSLHRATCLTVLGGHLFEPGWYGSLNSGTIWFIVIAHYLCCSVVFYNPITLLCEGFIWLTGHNTPASNPHITPKIIRCIIHFIIIVIINGVIEGGDGRQERTGRRSFLCVIFILLLTTPPSTTLRLFRRLFCHHTIYPSKILHCHFEPLNTVLLIKVYMAASWLHPFIYVLVHLF